MTSKYRNYRKKKMPEMLPILAVDADILIEYESLMHKSIDLHLYMWPTNSNHSTP